MLTRTKQNRRKVGTVLILTGLSLIITVLLIDMQLRPQIRKAGAYRCQVAATRIIESVMYAELQNQDYTNLVELTRDDSGNIVSIQSNMAGINRLKSRASQLINDGISSIADYGTENELLIPLGTVTGIHMFYGRGPALPIKLSPRGYAEVRLISEFTSAGINQTLHRITMDVSVDIAAIIPGYTTKSETVTVQTEFIVAQTVIIGHVPESYTHVIIG